MISYSVNANDETFDLEVAVPLGLILNEAITNSVKYAFNELKIGQIDISLKCDESEFCVLVISDNGVGIDDGYINGSKETLGIELINILSEQLGGQALFSNEKGTELTISFKC
jgi:two-component sensor histidine kinase